MTTIFSVIISSSVTLIVGILTFLGVIYQTNKKADSQKKQLDTNHRLLEQQFIDYKEFLHQSNKELKRDIEALTERVNEHNNYGIRIPVIEKELESIKRRIKNLEEK